MELEKLKEIIEEVLSVDASELMPETTFMGDLGADSLDVFQMVMRIEEVFEIQLQAEEVKNLETVQDIYELIQTKKAEG